MKLTDEEVLSLVELSFTSPTLEQLYDVFAFWQDEDPTVEELLDFLLELEKHLTDH